MRTIPFYENFSKRIDKYKIKCEWL